ncbi:MAG: SpoIIE family protein phosphatase [Bacteroidales bacterium]|nr:SpoIIE family protein phosphatase [Bacteroidales bacterium]
MNELSPDDPDIIYAETYRYIARIATKYLAYKALATTYLDIAKLTDNKKYADSCYIYLKKVGNYDLVYGNYYNYINTRIKYVRYLPYLKRYRDALTELKNLKQYVDYINYDQVKEKYYFYIYLVYFHLKGDGATIKLAGDNMPVGQYIMEREHFQSLVVPLQEGNMVYMFSDGIPDQFGEKIQKKFLIRNLISALVSFADQPVDNQCRLLEKTIDDWRGNSPQMDDMTLVGIRIWKEK